MVIPCLHYVLVLPDATRVILRPRDNGIAFVVERARENFVLMSVESLNFISRFGRPYFAGLVRRSCYNFVSLRVELNFRDLILMPLQEGNTGSCEHIINACISVSASCRQFVSSRVKACVQHFVIMPSEGLDTLPRANIPKFASAVNAACQAVVACEVKLPA